MVKRRSPEATSTDADRIEAFANQADGGEAMKADPNAPRDYKKINVPFNEYEYEILEEASEEQGDRSRTFFDGQ
ncbi:hypothetical protein [Marinobacter sp. NP-4(2019)]|uniref:hypothetical protein n=1 Tax=Marinobacter sp. NP-4(2019) TaxID=2488665 RepID=UPI001D18E701|nr:hypothetical protein [Marinobacter sp. NP-4(2019)]